MEAASLSVIPATVPCASQLQTIEKEGINLVTIYSSFNSDNKQNYGGELHPALLTGRLKQKKNAEERAATFYAALLRNAKALPEGKRIHGQIAKDGLSSVRFVGNLLVQMYSKFGALEAAVFVFHKMEAQNVFTWTAIMTAYVQHGQEREALILFSEMTRKSIKPDQVAFLTILRACSILASITESKLIHAFILESDSETNLVIGTALFDVYGKSGDLDNAWRIFNKLPEPDLVLWNSMVTLYNRYNYLSKAIELLGQMQNKGLKPDNITFLGILNSCTSLANAANGKLIHSYVLNCNLESDVTVGNTLVHFYGSYGDLDNSCTAFTRIYQRNEVSWNSLLAIYAQKGSENLLDIFYLMQLERVKPNKITFCTILTAFSNFMLLAKGRLIHSHILNYQGDSELDLVDALILMYGKCMSMCDATKLFYTSTSHNVLLWNTFITVQTRYEDGKEIMQLFNEMQQEHFKPDTVTLSLLVDLCAEVTCLPMGKLLHAHAICTTSESDTVLGSTLINLYGNCSCLADAEVVFQRIHKRDVVSWTAIISAYAENGLRNLIIPFFQQMRMENLNPDMPMFIKCLSTCALPDALADGKLIHASIFQNRNELSTSLQNALINMYSKCGNTHAACDIFVKMAESNVVSWNSMIAAYAQNDYKSKAFLLYNYYMNSEAKEPDKTTFVTALVICADLAFPAQGKLMHAHIVCSGLDMDIIVGTSLVNMYWKCGSAEETLDMFNRLVERDIAIWNIVFTIYARYGPIGNVYQLFSQMHKEDVIPTNITYITLICECVNLLEGRNFHAHIVNNSYLNSDVVLNTALLDMYARCGSLSEAENLFNQMPFHDKTSWNAIIAAYAQHGVINVVIQLFQQMHLESIIQDRVSFISILSACSHAGLIDEGFHYFIYMSGDFCNIIGSDHYSCMIDLLGRAGFIDEANDLIDKMPFCPDYVAWSSFIGACNTYDEVERGEQITRSLLEFYPENASLYILFSNFSARLCKFSKQLKDPRISSL